MTLDKAKELLKLAAKGVYVGSYKELHDALNLGIEAFEEVDRARDGDPAFDGELLPGETDD